MSCSGAGQMCGWRMSEEENSANIKLLASKGVKILQLSPQLSAEFQEIGKKMTAEWAAKAGPEGAAILKAYGN